MGIYNIQSDGYSDPVLVDTKKASHRWEADGGPGKGILYRSSGGTYYFVNDDGKVFGQTDEEAARFIAEWGEQGLDGAPAEDRKRLEEALADATE